MKTPLIVPITEDNIAAAGSIHSISWQESHRSFCSAAFIAKHTPQAQTLYLQRELASGKKGFMIIDEVPLGIVTIHGSLIENLYILPEHQRRGYGSMLLEFAIEQCASVPTLFILSNNDDARRLYERKGFRSTGRINKLTDTLDECEYALR